MSKKQTRSTNLNEKSEYWTWKDNMCFNGIFCKKPNCEYDHPIINGKQIKGMKRTYTTKCANPSDNTKLNKYGHNLLMSYENICPAKKGAESSEKFWNNKCDMLENPSELIEQGSSYQACADARELFGNECMVNPPHLDISHHKTQQNMSIYAKDCRNKVRAIRFYNNIKKTRRRNVLSKLNNLRTNRHKWISQYNRPNENININNPNNSFYYKNNTNFYIKRKPSISKKYGKTKTKKQSYKGKGNKSKRMRKSKRRRKSKGRK